MQEEKIMNDQGTNKVYRFPTISLLEKRKFNNVNIEEIRANAIKIQQTLFSFGIRARISDINMGTRFTRYEIVPELGVRIKEITRRENEIKMAVNTTAIHIEAPIPGKAAIGIDIANKESPVVMLREIIESKEFKEFPAYLACAVGKDILGKTVVADIAKMSHLLVAGATGSGKTIFISSLIMSILYKAHPDDVKLIMVDTKGASLNIFNGIPHLLIPVVTDASKSLALLEWVRAEVKDRYWKFSDFGVRDIEGYNKSDRVLCKMPRILVIIDDLSDLMALHRGEAEQLIVRIAQISRAAGIHLVVATQRPSTDVFTGLIKANMPSRVAFHVVSAMDSRIILDEKGAEHLMGNGDMLFKPQGCMRPIRIQGANVSDDEILNVVDFLKNQLISMETYKANIEQKNESYIEYDQYTIEAGKFIIEKDKASIGMIQRIFKIGFNRAARIMDELCQLGVVGEEGGTKPRKILMSVEEFEKLIEDKL